MTKETVWAFAVMVVAGTAGIVGLAAVGDQQSATLLPLLVGFLAPTITSLLNGQKLDKIDGRLNGELDSRIEAAVQRAITKQQEPEQPVS